MEKVILPVFVEIGDLWQHCSVTFIQFLNATVHVFI